MKKEYAKQRNTSGLLIIISIITIVLLGVFIFCKLQNTGFVVTSDSIPAFPQDLADKIIAGISITEKLVCASEYKTKASTSQCKASDCGKDKYINCSSYKQLITRKWYYQEVCQKNYEIKCSENPVCKTGELEISRTLCEGVSLSKLKCSNDYNLEVSSSVYSKKNCGSDKYLSRSTQTISGKKKYYLTCQKEYFTECLERPACNAGDKEIKKEEC